MTQRCGCPTVKDDGGRLMRDEKSKALKAHRRGCKPSWGYVFDAAPLAGGKRRQITKTGYKTQREAQRELTAALEAEARGVRVDTGRLTVGAYLDEWLASRLRLRPSTARSYEAHLRLYLKPALGALRLADLRHADIDRVFAALVTEGRLSPTTLKRVHATLNKALNDAVKRHLLVVNPAAHVELPRAHAKGFDIWTPTQLADFLHETRDDRHWPLYRLAAFTGMRRGELAGLRWVDVDNDLGLLHIRQQRVQLGYAVIEGPPKTKSGQRTVQLDADTVAVLRTHALSQEAEKIVAGEAWRGDDYVFCHEDGAPLHPEFVTRRFVRLVQRLDLPKIRLHDLRHTHASHGLAAGISMKVIQERLGHSSLALTADTYTHVMPHVASEAASIIARLTLAARPALAPREHGTAETTLGVPSDGENAQVIVGAPPGT